MADSPLQKLHQKVQQAAHELASARKERERLSAELDLIRTENRRARRVLREHGELLAERNKIKQKVKVILEKLDKLRV